MGVHNHIRTNPEVIERHVFLFNYKTCKKHKILTKNVDSLCVCTGTHGPPSDVHGKSGINWSIILVGPKTGEWRKQCVHEPVNVLFNYYLLK